MLLLHVDIGFMILYCRYWVHSGDKVLLSNLQFETRMGVNNREIFTKVISFKILSKESRV